MCARLSVLACLHARVRLYVFVGTCAHASLRVSLGQRGRTCMCVYGCPVRAYVHLSLRTCTSLSLCMCASVCARIIVCQRQWGAKPRYISIFFSQSRYKNVVVEYLILVILIGLTGYDAVACFLKHRDAQCTHTHTRIHIDVCFCFVICSSCSLCIVLFCS